MHHAARTIVAVVLSCACVASPTLAAPTSTDQALDLRGSWFHVVRPYDYVEARRFEAGWNRGADVRAAFGRVRSPVKGVVRFAGDVAGRAVVTVSTTIAGAPTIVTLTDLDSIDVSEGAKIGVGDVLGHGSLVHVGAYDARRRSRYLPVRAVDEGVLAVADSAGDRSARSTIADGIADRLQAAILGAVRPESVGTTGPTIRGPRMDRVVVPSRRGADEAARFADPGTRSDGAVVRSLRARDDVARVRGPSARVDRTVGRSVRVRDVVARGMGGVARRTRRDARVDGWRPIDDSIDDSIDVAAGWTSSGAEGADATPTVRAPRPVEGHAVEAATVGVGPQGTREDNELPGRAVDVGAAGVEFGAWRWIASAGALACALASAILPVLLRRRRRSVDTPRLPHVPLPLHLPHVRPYAYPVVRTDGSSVLPDVAVAWSARDVGTCPDTDPHARDHERAPEHA